MGDTVLFFFFYFTSPHSSPLTPLTISPTTSSGSSVIRLYANSMDSCPDFLLSVLGTSIRIVTCKHTNQVHESTLTTWRQSLRCGILDWDGILGWYTEMVYWNGILTWFTGMVYWDGILRWYTEMVYWDGLLGWYTEMVYGNGILTWFTGMVYWDGILRWYTEMVYWDGLLGWFTGIVYWDGLLGWYTEMVTGMVTRVVTGMVTGMVTGVVYRGHSSSPAPFPEKTLPPWLPLRRTHGWEDLSQWVCRQEEQLQLMHTNREPGHTVNSSYNSLPHAVPEVIYHKRKGIKRILKQSITKNRAYVHTTIFGNVHIPTHNTGCLSS